MIILCDRCKKKSININHVGSNGWIHLTKHGVTHNIETYLCNECAKEFHKFVEGRRLEYLPSDPIMREVLG